jgi:hypothetical protein
MLQLKKKVKLAQGKAEGGQVTVDLYQEGPDGAYVLLMYDIDMTQCCIWR